MKNRFFYYQLLDEREEQLINKAGTESFKCVYRAHSAKLSGGCISTCSF